MTKSHWRIMLFIVVAGIGCSGKEEIPRGILPQDQMEQLVWDMAQADQYAAIYLVKDSSKVDLKTETLRLYEEVFRLHHVTREEFNKSYRYYLDHPQLDQLLFDSVTARGARARTDMYERPFYHPSALPSAARPGMPPVIPGRTIGGVPGRLNGVAIPGRPVGRVPGGVMPGAAVIPGRKMPAPGAAPAKGQALTPDEMRRQHEAAMHRSQDSLARVLRIRADSIRNRH